MHLNSCANERADAIQPREVCTEQNSFAWRHQLGLFIFFFWLSMGLLPVDFPPFQPPPCIADMVLPKGRRMRSILSKQVSVFFSCIPPASGLSFFLWFVLALSD
jgi:hypothetical protein